MDKNIIINIFCIVTIIGSGAGIGVLTPRVIEKFSGQTADENSDENDNNTISSDSSNCAELPALESLSKKELLAIYAETAISMNKGEEYIYMVCDFIPEPVSGGEKYDDFRISRSFSGEVDKEAIKKDYLLYNISSVDSSSKYYSVVSGVSKDSMSGNDTKKRILVFNDKYMDYGNSNNKLKDTSAEFVSEAMRIIAYNTRDEWSARLSNLYNYELVDEGDHFVFSFYHVGVGLDMDKTSYSGTGEIEYAYRINAIRSAIRVDKESGTFERMELEDENGPGYLQVIKSYPFGEEDSEWMEETYGKYFEETD